MELIELKFKHKIVIAFVMICFIVSCVYGYILLKQGQQENCWDKYKTEVQAILNCEGKE
jgi:hypothetical protein